MGASSMSEPTSPPPSLPPPPPPSTDGPLFDTTPLGGETSLFADAPIDAPEPEATAAPSTKPAQGSKSGAEEPSSPRPRAEGEEGTVIDSYEFILRNLLEMNRLWIRIRNLPGDRTKETRRRRERERNDLRILVGSNLNRLSQLEGVTAHTYGSKILPRILEEISGCRDPLAQAYLMDCIIQVFPDEYHLETLEVFLGACPRLREKVNVRTILSNMMERLLHYCRKDDRLSNDEEDTNDVKMTMALHGFDMFEDCVARVYEARGTGIPPKDVVRLQGCLLNYALKIAPPQQSADMIGRCIGRCASALGTLREQKRASMAGRGIVVGGVTRESMEIDMCDVATVELEKLLSVPLNSMGLRALDMPDFGELLGFLPWENRRKVAVSMVKSVIGRTCEEGSDNGGDHGSKRVKSAIELERLFVILAPLLRDEGAAAPPAIHDDHHSPSSRGGGSLISRTANLMGTLGINGPSMGHDDLFGGGGGITSGAQQQSFHGDASKLAQFRTEQALVAKLVHALDHKDTDTKYQMLNAARRHIQPGGAARISITLPAVVFAALGLLRRVQGMEFPEPVQPAPVVAVEKDEPEVKDQAEDEAKKDDDEDGNEGAEAEPEESGPAEESKEEPEAESKESGAAEESKEEPEAGDGGEEETAADDGVKAEKDSPATAELEKIEKQSAADEVVKEEKTETEPTAPIVEDVPKELFPEFTKSVNCRKILVFLQKTVAALAPSNPELAFKLYLEIAVSADLLARSARQRSADASAEFTGIAYDFLTQAFLVYEDEISDSNVQVRAITSIVGSLLACETFEKTDYEALITKTAQYAAKLLKKPDQCRMVCLCSRLFYVGGKDDVDVYRNPQRVLECLQRGLKIADACSMSSSANVQLFVEILDYYVYYYEIENPVITDKFVSGLIALINEHFDSIGAAGTSVAISESRAYYGQILEQIKRQKADDATKERFGLIVC